MARLVGYIFRVKLNASFHSTQIVDKKDGYRPNKEGAIGNFFVCQMIGPLDDFFQFLSFFFFYSLSLSLSMNFSRVLL